MQVCELVFVIEVFGLPFSNDVWDYQHSRKDARSFLVPCSRSPNTIPLIGSLQSQPDDIFDKDLGQTGSGNSPFGNIHRQYLDCIIETCRTISTAEFVADVGGSRSGGSPINVLVTARADLEIDLKL
jgi:hypothetical protein